MHKYEEMFLNNKKELEKLIEDLTNKSLNNNTDDEVKAELAEISKYVDYEVDLQATFNFEPHCNYFIGTASFSSVEAFNEAKEDLNCWECFDNITAKYDVDWDGEPSDGVITIDDDVMVGSVNAYGLNDDNCCQEAFEQERVLIQERKIQK